MGTEDEGPPPLVPKNRLPKFPITGDRRPPKGLEPDTIMDMGRLLPPPPLADGRPRRVPPPDDSVAGVSGTAGSAGRLGMSNGSNGSRKGSILRDKTRMHEKRKENWGKRKRSTHF